MKKTLLTIASLAFAGAASAADPFASPFLSGTPDLYSGMNESASVPTAQQPGIGDSYGGNIFEGNDLLGVARVPGNIPRGTNDAYGSPIPNVEAGQLDW